MKPCKVCEDPTDSVFNINFKAVPICENCATRIFIQQAMWYAKGEAVTPKTTVGVVAHTMNQFIKWAEELQEKHPNEFKLKFNGKSRFVNEKTNTEYICMSQPHHTCGYSLDDFIELPYARDNKHFDKIMEALMPCLITRK